MFYIILAHVFSLIFLGSCGSQTVEKWLCTEHVYSRTIKTVQFTFSSPFINLSIFLLFYRFALLLRGKCNVCIRIRYFVRDNVVNWKPGIWLWFQSANIFPVQEVLYIQIRGVGWLCGFRPVLDNTFHLSWSATVYLE